MWKDDKKAAGYREVNAWLSPDALAALDAIRPVVGKVAVGDLIGAALIHAAGAGWRYGGETGSQVVPGDELADLRPALDDLLARVARIETQAQAVTPAKELETETGIKHVETVPPAKAKPKKEIKAVSRPPWLDWPEPRGSDLAAIKTAVAEKLAEKGDGFNRSKLHRELKSAGVKVPSRAESFCRIVATLIATGQVKASM